MRIGHLDHQHHEEDGNQAEAYHLGKAIFLKVIEFSIAFKPTFKPMRYQISCPYFSGSLLENSLKVDP